MLFRSNPEEPASWLFKKGVFPIRKALFLTLTGGYTLNPELYREMFRILENQINEYWKNRMTLLHFSGLWVKNLLYNLPALIKSKALESLRIDKPVLILGAGESLEDSIPFIKAHGNSFFLCAVDTALPVLKEIGVSPNAIISLESQWINLQDFIGCKAKGIPLICDITVLPQVCRLFRGNTYFFSSRFADLRLLKTLDNYGLLPFPIPPLGSVGVTAVYLFNRLYSGPIFLTGLDFSYSLGKTHARGTPSLLHHLSKCNRLDPNPLFKGILRRPVLDFSDQNGNRVKSDLVLSGYADLLKNILSGKDNVFNLGKGGLYLGARVADPPQALKSSKILKKETIKGTSKYYPETTLFSRSSLEAFFIEEKTKIQHFNRLGHELLSGRFENLDAFKSLLPDFDHLLLGLPEAPLKPYNSPLFQAKIVSRLEEYNRVLEKASCFLHYSTK